MKTQWGVRSQWGEHPAPSLEEAETMIKNMRKSGLEVSLVWRGITEWQEEDRLDD